jgi:hypothetical protein
VHSGLTIDGTDYFPSESIQGVFNIGNPVVRSSSNGSVVSLEGYDNFALLNGTISGAISDIVYQINVGTSLNDAISAVLSDASIIQNPLMDSNSYELYYTLVKEIGNTYADVLIELADMASMNIYFDVTGRPILKEPVDEQNSAHVWEFRNDEVSYLGSDHNYNYAEVRNHIVVYGENINGDLAYAEAEDTNLFSPTSVSRIGQRTKTINDNYIISDTEAQARADYELKNAIQSYEYTNLRTYNIDFLKEGDIILIKDTDGGFDAEKYLIKQINRNLAYNGEMTIQAWKVRAIS